jgi:hypothetical protein
MSAFLTDAVFMLVSSILELERMAIDGWISELRNHFCSIAWNFLWRSSTSPSRFIALGLEGAAGVWETGLHGFCCLAGRAVLLPCNQALGVSGKAFRG